MLSDIIWIGAWWGKAFPLSVMCKLVLSGSGQLTVAETQISFVRCNTFRSQHGPGSACYGPEPWATRRSPQYLIPSPWPGSPRPDPSRPSGCRSRHGRWGRNTRACPAPLRCSAHCSHYWLVVTSRLSLEPQEFHFWHQHLEWDIDLIPEDSLKEPTPADPSGF